MDSNETLREIADELHNLNLNMCELINVLNGKQQSPKIGDELDDTLDAIAETMRLHREQLAGDAAKATTASIGAEDAYQKKQQNFDQALKKLGVL
jgi:predicted transcriptional regulator